MKNVFYLFSLILLMGLSSHLSAQNPGDSTDVYGCMDPEATNYNPLATIDNGYCIYYCDSTTAYFWFDPASTDSIVNIFSFTYSPTGISSYFWDFGDGSTSTEATPNHLYTDAGIYTICLTVTAEGQASGSICTNLFCDSLYFEEGSYLNTIVPIYGCMDPSALNYDPLATISSNYCLYEEDSTDVYGCTDPMALNYNQLATIDDGSCIYDNDSTDIYGCTDPTAANYNPLATIDDGSCYYDSTAIDVYGCMDELALNYNPLATIDDGSCIYVNDSTDVYGCMDTSATNYNPLATIDDGSCVYYCDSTQAYFYVSNIDEASGIVTVVNSSFSLDSITEYLWDFGDGTTSSEAYPSHEYASPGFYTLCLTIIAGAPSGFLYCTSTYCDSIGIPPSPPGFGPMSGFTINIIAEGSTTGIDELEFADLKLYPNPAQENLTLSFSLEKQSDITTTIYDLGGRVLITYTRNVSPGNQKESINISDLPSGMYQLELRNNDSRNVQRFQVIK